MALAIRSNKFLTAELILILTAAIVQVHLHQEAIHLAQIQVHQVAAAQVHLEAVAEVVQLVRAEVAIKS